MSLLLLVTPLAAGAYFADVASVARAELAACFPGAEAALVQRATLTFLAVDLPADAAGGLSRLSFVQAVFVERPDGALDLLDADPGFDLPAELVTGARYRGKTNELLTQMVLNLALATCRADVDARGPKLLDPMAGRGTTLLWAARYGIEARGIELDERALGDLQRHVGRQTKLLKVKHQRDKGGGKRGASFVGYRFERAGLKLLHGDAREAGRLLDGERFHLLVSDLPYGIEHRSGPGGARDPRAVLAACAPEWAERLRPGGAMVLAYNRLLPPREVLAGPFVEAGLTLLPVEAPHRMSESILRDVLVMRRPA
jgi:hypothetical protein